MGLYLVKPEVKPGVVWPSTPKDAKPLESQYAYFARKYMAAQAARNKKKGHSKWPKYNNIFPIHPRKSLFFCYT